SLLSRGGVLRIKFELSPEFRERSGQIALQSQDDPEREMIVLRVRPDGDRPLHIRGGTAHLSHFQFGQTKIKETLRAGWVELDGAGKIAVGFRNFSLQAVIDSKVVIKLPCVGSGLPAFLVKLYRRIQTTSFPRQSGQVQLPARASV